VAFVLKIDHRGRVWDGIQDDATWDPQWFVAHVETERVWTIEAAIPLSALSGDLAQLADSQWWGLGIERLCPGSIRREWGVTSSAVGAASAHADLINGLLRIEATPANAAELR